MNCVPKKTLQQTVKYRWPRYMKVRRVLKQAVRKQTGGYFLRKRKSNSTPDDNSSASGNSNGDGKAANKKNCNKRESEKSLPCIDETSAMTSPNNLIEDEKRDNSVEEQHINR